MSDVKLGVIGLGNIGQQHIKHIQSDVVNNCTITAVSSRAPNEIATVIGAKHFTDYHALIDSGLCDGVLIASPTMNHLEMGLYALEKGLHVLMEKPIALSVKDGQTLIDTASEKQQFGLMLNQRVDPIFTKMKKLIDDGALGALQRTQWTMTNWFRPEVYFQVSDWRATWKGEGGGLLVNQCIHNIDIFQWLCGMPKSVTGFCGFGKYHDIEVEDEASAFFQYKNGATGIFVGSTGEAPGVNQLDIVGDKGMLSYNGQHLFLTKNTPATSQFSKDTVDMFGQPVTETTNITPTEEVNQHGELINNFVNAILGRESLIAPAEQGLDSLAIANGILWSSWTDQKVTFPIDMVGYQAALNENIKQSKLREKSDIKANIDMEKSYR